MTEINWVKSEGGDTCPRCQAVTDVGEYTGDDGTGDDVVMLVGERCVHCGYWYDFDAGRLRFDTPPTNTDQLSND